MPSIKNQHDLQPLNTFGIKASAQYFIEVSSEKDLPELPELKQDKILIMGGGSNILFTKDFEGIIVQMKISGINIEGEDEQSVIVSAGGGVEWDELVAFAVLRNLGGIENLSIIPGSVGAAPVQNIGAYGMEVKDTIEKVECYDLMTGMTITFSNRDCGFSYRYSVFKGEFKNRLLITKVYFRLKKPPHTLVTTYGNIAELLPENPSITDVRNIITGIRQSKLPDHKVTGNAGSFFKNPVVHEQTALKLKELYPGIPIFPEATGLAKISAAWLIDQSGCKGITRGRAGTHPKQPLVLINLGGASGSEIFELAQYVQGEVLEKFGIMLEPEVNVY